MLAYNHENRLDTPKKNKAKDRILGTHIYIRRGRLWRGRLRDWRRERTVKSEKHLLGVDKEILRDLERAVSF